MTTTMDVSADTGEKVIAKKWHELVSAVEGRGSHTEFRRWRGATRRAQSVHRFLGVLEDLGSADAIARFFYHEGVRGAVGDSHNCPVQKWLRIETGVEYFVSLEYVNGFTGSGAIERVAPLPRAAQEFVMRFDMGHFPDVRLPKSDPTAKLVSA